MQAIVQDTYGSADVLALREIATPTVGDNDVLVRVHAAGLDPSVWHLMTGRPYMVRLAFGLRKPKTPVRGSDLAGQVAAVGRNVTRFQPGDEVFGVGEGTFAEYALARSDRLALKPSALTFEQAAAVPISATTALQGLRDQGQLQAGQRVLITGAGGGVGTFAVQLAKALGASVTGVSSTSKTELVRSLGADHVIDYTREDFTAGDRRYDLILDIAGIRPLTQLRRALTPHGTLVIVGGEGGDRWLGGFDRQILRAPLLSLFVSQKLRGLMAQDRAADLEYLSTSIEAGQLRPIIDRTYPLHAVPDAIRYLEQGRARGKVVITIAQTITELSPALSSTALSSVE